MAGTRGESLLAKTYQVGKNAKYFHTVRKQLRPERRKEKEKRKERKQQRERQGERDGEKEKERKDRRRVHERESQKEQEGQGRLVARPFMARTRRGRQGVSPGT